MGSAVDGLIERIDHECGDCHHQIAIHSFVRLNQIQMMVYRDQLIQMVETGQVPCACHYMGCQCEVTLEVLVTKSVVCAPDRPIDPAYIPAGPKIQYSFVEHRI